MKFSYSWLKELARFEESPKEIAEILNLHSFETETIGKAGLDFTLDAKIPANRISDAAHHYGLAREIAAIKNYKSDPRSSRGRGPKRVSGSKPQSSKISLRIKIAEPDLCPRYTAQELEVKNIGRSPEWMHKRLATCGMRPIDAVVDITNYVMLETGQPLHAFDLDRIADAKMTIRESKKGEELETLDGTKHRIPEGTIVIEDGKRLIDLAGIMGGANSAVSSGTKRILLQAAAFDPAKIYRTTRILNFSSAAAKIYSAGTDPNQTQTGISRAIELFAEILEARAVGQAIDIYPRKVHPLRILFRPEYASRVIGQNFTPVYCKSILQRLGCAVKRKGADFIVQVPTIRRDLQIEEDLIEEIARITGYESIKPKLPEVPILPPISNEEYFWAETVRNYLTGAGFSESILYQFVGARELEQFFIDPADAPALENPMNPGTKYLVPRVLIKYISSAAENLRNLDAVKIFGIGKSFTRIRNQELGIRERKDLIITLTRKGGSGEEGFYLLKGVVDELLESMGISDHWYDDAADYTLYPIPYTLFHPYRVAEIKIGDEKIGMIGEIHPAVLENIKSKARIAAAEIDMARLASLATAEAEFQPIGKYPAIVRDIAVVVPSDTKTEEVQNIIENIGGALLADTDLFDYFQDEQMRGSEEKSLAFRLIFQSADRTLTDAEIDALIKKITSALEEKGWEVRK